MQIVQIKCFDRCIYRLEFPKFFEEYAIAKCKKLFQFLFQFDYKPGNDETIAFLDVALPALIEEKKQEWADRSHDFQNGYLATDYAALPSTCNYRNVRIKEVKRREENNDRLLRAVKSAKSKHDHAQKVWESYTEAKAKFS